MDVNIGLLEYNARNALWRKENEEEFRNLEDQFYAAGIVA